MIVSASRRTDIPAFFHEWFYNRINEGFIFVRNPMNIHQISKIKVSPDVVDCIVFWTKNPIRMLSRLDELKQYDYYFQFTITGYGKKLEPNVLDLKQTIDVFKKLSDVIGEKRVIWRYDPIIISDDFNIDYHEKMFNYIASHLANKTKRCVISFVDLYKNTAKNMSRVSLSNISNEMLYEISSRLKYISNECNIELTTCAEEIDLQRYGIAHGKCIDDKLIEEIFNVQLNIGKDKNQRDECGCMASIDIGAYNTCPHGCLYCYANYNLNHVRNNYSLHNPDSPLLFGEIGLNDKIMDRKVESCKIYQRTLF